MSLGSAQPQQSGREPGARSIGPGRARFEAQGRFDDGWAWSQALPTADLGSVPVADTKDSVQSCHYAGVSGECHSPVT